MTTASIDFRIKAQNFGGNSFVTTGHYSNEDGFEYDKIPSDDEITNDEFLTLYADAEELISELAKGDTSFVEILIDENLQLYVVRKCYYDNGKNRLYYTNDGLAIVNKYDAIA